MDDYLSIAKQIRDRIAPNNPSSYQIRFSAVNPGTVIQTYSFTGPYNSFLVSILAGTVYAYLGTYAANALPPVPDFIFGPTVNPLPIAFQARNDLTITLVCPSSSSNSATGTIYIGYY